MSLTEVLRRADAYVEQGDLVLAFECYKEAVSIARKMKKVTDDVLIAYNNLVIIRLRTMGSKNELIEARDYALEFVRVAKKSKYRSDMYAVANFILGLIFMSLKDFKKAAKYLEEAALVFEIIGHEEGLMLASKNLAEAYVVLGFKTKAEIQANRAKAIAKRMGKVKKLKEIENMIKNWERKPWMLMK